MIRCPKCKKVAPYVERAAGKPVVTFFHSPTERCQVTYGTQREARKALRDGVRAHEREVR